MSKGLVKGSERDKGAMINERITFPKMQLIGADGKNEGVVSREEALRQADQAALDLVIIAEQGPEGLPIAKIINYGKMLYEKKKQQNEAKKKQQVVEVKELQFRTKIAEHDFITKMNQGLNFLKEGKHFKIVLTFGKGREMLSKEERGPVFFEKVQQFFDEAGISGSLTQEKEQQAGHVWSRIYYLKK